MAPPGAAPPQGATPWQPPDGQAGVLQLPPGVNPQNLLIIASPSPDRPDGQVLHVYMIQPPAGQAPDVNVTVPHNQGGAAPVVAVPGAVPIASVATGIPLASAGGPPPMNEVLGLPWGGDTARPPVLQPAVTARPRVGEQSAARAAGTLEARQAVYANGGQLVTGMTMLQPMMVPVQEVRPATEGAAVETGATGSTGQPNKNAEGKPEKQTTGKEPQTNAEGEDAAGRPDATGRKTEEASGVDGEGEIVLGMVSEWGETIRDEDEDAEESLPGQRQGEDGSLAQPQDPASAAEESRGRCETDVLNHEHRLGTPESVDAVSSEASLSPGSEVKPPEPKPVVLDTGSNAASIPSGPEEEASEVDSEPRATGSEPETKDSEPGTKDSEPKAKDSEPGTKDSEPETKDSGLGTKDSEPGTKNSEPGTKDSEPETKDSEPGTKDSEPGTKDDAKTTEIKQASLCQPAKR